MTFAQEHQEVDSELGHGQDVSEQKELPEQGEEVEFKVNQQDNTKATSVHLLKSAAAQETFRGYVKSSTDPSRFYIEPHPIHEFLAKHNITSDLLMPSRSASTMTSERLPHWVSAALADIPGLTQMPAEGEEVQFEVDEADATVAKAVHLEEKAKQKKEDEAALSHRQKLLNWNLCGDRHGRWWNCPEEFGRVDGHTKLCQNA